ncbi:hypothetical protein ACFWWC_24560 [Streptomyces sp. NPDC058642]|uniref:hypothetical protein n=1 Tax=Streptomyces sp. NPDC058642 TaxID=3346572 RepID=UPI00366392A8
MPGAGVLGVAGVVEWPVALTDAVKKENGAKNAKGTTVSGRSGPPSQSGVSTARHGSAIGRGA